MEYENTLESQMNALNLIAEDLANDPSEKNKGKYVKIFDFCNMGPQIQSKCAQLLGRYFKKYLEFLPKTTETILHFCNEKSVEVRVEALPVLPKLARKQDQSSKSYSFSQFLGVIRDRLVCDNLFENEINAVCFAWYGLIRQNIADGLSILADWNVQIFKDRIWEKFEANIDKDFWTDDVQSSLNKCFKQALSTANEVQYVQYLRMLYSLPMYQNQNSPEIIKELLDEVCHHLLSFDENYFFVVLKTTLVARKSIGYPSPFVGYMADQLFPNYHSMQKFQQRQVLRAVAVLTTWIGQLDAEKFIQFVYHELVANLPRPGEAYECDAFNLEPLIYAFSNLACEARGTAYQLCGVVFDEGTSDVNKFEDFRKSLKNALNWGLNRMTQSKNPGVRRAVENSRTMILQLLAGNWGTQKIHWSWRPEDPSRSNANNNYYSNNNNNYRPTYDNPRKRYNNNQEYNTKRYRKRFYNQDNNYENSDAAFSNDADE